MAFAVAGTNSTTGDGDDRRGGPGDVSWTGTTPGEDLLTAWEDINGNGADEPDEAGGKHRG